MQQFSYEQNQKQSGSVMLNIFKTMFENHQLRGELKLNESMAKYTSWKTGGTADYFYRPADIEDLEQFLQCVPPDMSIYWIGYGSNLLVRDAGIRGVVISVVGIMDQLEIIDANTVCVGAGISCVKAARFSAKQGLSGIEFLAGIPGTIGGALAMNAGAWGGETWGYVIKAKTINRQGFVKEETPERFSVGYRSVVLGNDEWFIDATLKLNASTREKAEETIRNMLAERAEKQPLGQHSCGSVFRNPKDDHAARLIESSGLKGKKMGGAQVSDKHANFIINTGNAKAIEIENLISEVINVVKLNHGITLVPEVRVIGESFTEENRGLC